LSELPPRRLRGCLGAPARARRVACALALGVLASVPAEPGASAEECKGTTASAELIRKGDALLEASSTTKQAWAVVWFYRQALERSPDCFEAQWKLARAYMWVAELDEEKGGNPSAGKLGYDAAFRSIQLDPKRVEGYFWAALCVGEHGRGLGILRAINQGIGAKFRRYLDFAMGIDRAYEWGGVDRVLGCYYNTLPWPLRDNKKSVEHFERALRYSPRHPRTLYYMAKVLLSIGRREEARTRLKVCVSLRPDEGSARLIRHYLVRCRGLLGEASAP
jgi:tetratricopeptide (TPR) repeat protein